MKRVLALLVVMAFVATIAAPVFAATPSAIKVYIAQLQAKLKVAQKQKAKARIATLTKMIAQQKAALAKAEAEMMAPPPPPVAVPPPPPPVRAVPPPPAPTGLFGMGLDTSAELGMVAGMLGLLGNVILPDPMGLGAMVGLPANAVAYKLGLGYAQGNDTNSNSWKAVPIVVDGLISLPADMMGGVETFVGGGLNYVVYRSGQTGGSIGGQIYVGAQGDLGLGLGGKTYGELGYSILRTGPSTEKPMFSSKSVTVLIGQKILL